MSKVQNNFVKASENIAFDLEHRKRIKFNMSKYQNAIKNGKGQFINLENARRRAFYLKNRIIENLDKQLIEFESNFESNGGKIIWANDVKEAQNAILDIIKNNNYKYIVKSKSMITEEIELNKELESISVQSIETDLGEFIVQIAGEKPYHIVTPAMHKSKEDIALLFNEKFNTDKDASPDFITNYVRKELREKFRNASVGITGANFLVAESGSIALTENEGNAILSTSFPKIHIAICGIEKMIPNLKSLNLYWPLLAGHGTGQNVTVYNSLFNGVKSIPEEEGPEQLYLVLLNNGRTNILKNNRLRPALNCIKCGSCLNECPVYHNIGGYTYKSVYSGPIGSIISPYIGNNYDEYSHLTFACTLCGNCEDKCPVKIPLAKMLLRGRREYVKRKKYSFIENMSMFMFKTMMKNRSNIEKGSTSFKNFGIKIFFQKGWGKRRVVPKLANKSFNKTWREKSI